MSVGDLGGGNGSWKPSGDLKIAVVHNVAAVFISCDEGEYFASGGVK